MSYPANQDHQNERRAFALNSVFVVMAQQGRTIATNSDGQAAWLVAEILDELAEAVDAHHPNAVVAQGPVSARLQAVEEALMPAAE
jgi:hypothetical protein